MYTNIVLGEWLNGRVAVSKTVGCVFESRLPCQNLRTERVPLEMKSSGALSFYFSINPKGDEECTPILSSGKRKYF